MTGVFGITLDNRLYQVLVEYESLKRTFSLEEGPNNGKAITGRPIRDILGTSYTYKLKIMLDPDHPEDYDAFYDQISAPVDYHTVSLPFNQGVMTFDAMIESGSDTYYGNDGQNQIWDQLELTFKPMDLQRT